jgi:DNA-binding NtrC family response regulator
MGEFRDARKGGPGLKMLLETYERKLIEAALVAHSGNQRQAAAMLGVLPTTLHEKMKRLGLLRRGGRAESAEARGLDLEVRAS